MMHRLCWLIIFVIVGAVIYFLCERQRGGVRRLFAQEVINESLIDRPGTYVYRSDTNAPNAIGLDVMNMSDGDQVVIDNQSENPITIGLYSGMSIYFKLRDRGWQYSEGGDPTATIAMSAMDLPVGQRLSLQTFGTENVLVNKPVDLGVQSKAAQLAERYPNLQSNVSTCQSQCALVDATLTNIRTPNM